MSEAFHSRNPLQLRPAKVADTEALAQLQAVSMAHTLEATLGAPLSDTTRTMLDPVAFAATWQRTIGMLKPSQDVLVALDNTGVQGFLAGEITDNSDGELFYSISSMEISDFGREAGVAGALLSYVAAKAKKSWAEAIAIWLFAGDDAATAAATQAGFEPAGERRSFEIDGEELSQHLWRLELL